MKRIRVVSYIGLLLLCAFVTTSGANVTELDINPEVVVQGEALLIYGAAAPNEVVWINASFAISLPVLDGKFSREFNDIHFPDGEKAFSVTAENIKDIKLSLSPGFWEVSEYPLEGPENATNGTATISISFPVTWEGVTINGSSLFCMGNSISPLSTEAD